MAFFIFINIFFNFVYYQIVIISKITVQNCITTPLLIAIKVELKTFIELHKMLLNNFFCIMLIVNKNKNKNCRSGWTIAVISYNKFPNHFHLPCDQFHSINVGIPIKKFSLLPHFFILCEKLLNRTVKVNI